MSKRLFWVKYSAEDFLGGVETLSVAEELAYRRICDLIYKIGGPVMLDDRKLAGFTKLGPHWRRVKAALIKAGKLFETPDGGLMNRRCEVAIREATISMASESHQGVPSHGRSRISCTTVTQKPLKTLRARTRGREKAQSISKKVSRERAPAREGGAGGTVHTNGKINGSDPLGRSAPLAQKRKDLLEQKLMRFANATMRDADRHAAFVGLIGEDPEHSRQWWFDRLDQTMRAARWDDTQQGVT